MSTDNGPDLGTDSPVAGISKPKSNKKGWIFGGLGCLGLIALAYVAMIVLKDRADGPIRDFTNENISFIEISSEVSDKLGAPIKVGAPQITKDPANPDSRIFRGLVSGANGKGNYVIEADMKDETPVRRAIYFEVDGEQIDLDPEAMFDFQIDDGG